MVSQILSSAPLFLNSSSTLLHSYLYVRDVALIYSFFSFPPSINFSFALCIIYVYIYLSLSLPKSLSHSLSFSLSFPPLPLPNSHSLTLFLLLLGYEDGQYYIYVSGSNETNPEQYQVGLHYLRYQRDLPQLLSDTPLFHICSYRYFLFTPIPLHLNAVIVSMSIIFYVFLSIRLLMIVIFLNPLFLCSPTHFPPVFCLCPLQREALSRQQSSGAWSKRSR